MTVAFGIALWFAMAVWTYRDISTRSENPMVQIFSTLVVVLGFLPGLVIYLLLRPRETLEASYQRAIEEDYLAQELNSTPMCPTCGRIIRDEFIFCPSCGTEMRQACHSCGRLVDADWIVCAYCGAEQLHTHAASNGRRVERLRDEPRVREREVRERERVESWQVDLNDAASGQLRGDTGDLPASQGNPRHGQA